MIVEGALGHACRPGDVLHSARAVATGMQLSQPSVNDLRLRARPRHLLNMTGHLTDVNRAPVPPSRACGAPRSGPAPQSRVLRARPRPPSASAVMLRIPGHRLAPQDGTDSNTRREPAKRR